LASFVRCANGLSVNIARDRHDSSSVDHDFGSHIVDHVIRNVLHTPSMATKRARGAPRKQSARLRVKSLRMNRRQEKLVADWARERGVCVSDVIRGLIDKEEAAASAAGRAENSRNGVADNADSGRVISARAA